MRKDYPKIIGKYVIGIIDRPIGSKHPNYPNTIYPINYGYTTEYMAEDNQYQDIYLLSIDYPIKTFNGVVIAVYRRDNDNEDKWILSIDESSYSDEYILNKINFQEKHFKGRLLR